MSQKEEQENEFKLQEVYLCSGCLSRSQVLHRKWDDRGRGQTVRSLEETSRLWWGLTAKYIAWEKGRKGRESDPGGSGGGGWRSGLSSSPLASGPRHTSLSHLSCLSVWWQLSSAQSHSIWTQGTLNTSFKVLFEEGVKYHFIRAIVIKTGRTCLSQLPQSFLRCQGQPLPGR